MCDASNFAVGAVLGHRIDEKFKLIYYASKTLNNAQEHYTTTEKELLAVVFSFDKFLQYLVLSKTIVYTYHSALKYLFSKEDAKPRLISASITGWKVYESGFYWPSIFKDAKDYVMRCDACQRSYHQEVRCHKITFRQTKVINRAIKFILERSVGYNPKNWSKKLDDALWAFITACMTPTGCTPLRLVYGKACHLPVEIEHKSYWALKQCNMDLIAAAKNRFMELKELIELRDEAYENTRIYKE
ncbi:reverse transcriptase domain-containing protein [Tanacetum coccineum]